MDQANKPGNMSNNKQTSQKLYEQQSPKQERSAPPQQAPQQPEARQTQKPQGSQQWDDIKPRDKTGDAKSYESNRFNRTDLDKKSDNMDHDVNFDSESSDDSDNDIESKNTGGGSFQQTSNRGSVAQNFNKKNNPGTATKR